MKKYKKKRAGVFALAFVLSAVCALSIRPAAVKADEYWPEGPETASPSIIVMEVNTGTVLYEKNSHEQHYPASITKIMTTLLALENSSMDEVVTFSDDSINKTEGSGISRDYGEQQTMEQCLYAVMLESANECAYAVAEHVGTQLGGDYNTFIDLMNERAEELGCTDTHFHNANGLPDEEHWTSAYDMALIACEAYKNETFRSITGTGSYTIPPTNKHDVETPLHNHHKMLYPNGTAKYLYDYCTGGKTGYTTAANNTLVTYAEKDGMTLVCVIMNTDSPNHWTDTRTLLDYYFDNFQIFNISENETSIADNEMKDTGLLNNNESFVTLDTDAYIILPKTASFSDAVFERDTAQVDDATIATLKYTYADHNVGSVEIVTTGAKVEMPQFHNEEEQEDSDTKVVEVRPIVIVLVIIGLLLAAVLIYFGKRIYDNFYVIRHNLSVRRNRKDRFREIKKRKRRRRRDRLFK